MKAFFSHLKLSPEWLSLEAAERHDFMERQREQQGHYGGLKIGDISSVKVSSLYEGLHETGFEYLLKLLPFEALQSTGDKHIDSQILMCAGAGFHQDVLCWDNSVFFNWYLGGEPMDFVMPHAGIRQTLRPGDIVAFDPSQVHALVRPGEAVSDASSWPTDALVQEKTFQFFLSLDFKMTPSSDAWFGIERGSEEELHHKGYTTMDVDRIKVDNRSGAISLPSQ